MAGRLMDNLLKDYAGTHCTWDERGNLIERTWNGEKTVFTWDGFNRMRSASTYGKTTSFSYDALGRRIAKRSEHDVTLFGWDGDTLAFESTQSTEGQQEQQAWRGDSVHYIHEPGSFVPLMQIRQAQAVALSQTTDVKALIAANGGRYDIEQDPLWNGEQFKTPQAFAKEEIAFYQCDHLGTPQELTDHEGRIAWSASYKAWGEAKQAISEAGRKAGFRNPIRFQGQYWDAETGLHYNRHRYYDPHSGRFISSDPIKLAGGANLHRFAPNPITWVDPGGLCSTTLDRNLGGVSGDEMQAHHVIPEEVWANNAAFLNKVGLTGQRDDRANGMLLPGSQAKAKKMGKKVYHCGSHALYSAMVDARVKSIQTAYDGRAITAGEAKQEIGDLQNQLKLAINAGMVPRNPKTGRLM
ncbi:RHS repeat domain-containing protein [Variovorax paradoxus]|uniref:RHS repeat domain-containing protein n=1 Tax=Variovorax paradoxus TaxID=34073 RepID=UPI0029C746A4|nr:RHS repeat-associated core domain-containing protein [Variovorax paradoxus]WPH23682.1 RHS repeat-associated core domain-containing protein [Variovorax paradoxus]